MEAPNFRKLLGSLQVFPNVGAFPEATVMLRDHNWDPSLHVFMNCSALPLGPGRTVIPGLPLFTLTVCWLLHRGLSQPALQIISHLVTTEMAILQLAASIKLNLQLALALFFSLPCDGFRKRHRDFLVAALGKAWQSDPRGELGPRRLSGEHRVGHPWCATRLRALPACGAASLLLLLQCEL